MTVSDGEAPVPDFLRVYIITLLPLFPGPL